MPSGKHTFEQALVTLNGADVTADVSKAKVMIGRRPPVEITSLADTYDQFLSPNIRRWGVTLDYFNNYSTSGISSVLKTVFQATSAPGGVAFVLRTYATEARGSSNPEWSGNVGIDGDFDISGGAEGDPNAGSITLKGMGTLSFLTSSSA